MQATGRLRMRQKKTYTFTGVGRHKHTMRKLVRIYKRPN